jgi:hypothetical protein
LKHVSLEIAAAPRKIIFRSIHCMRFGVKAGRRLNAAVCD